MSVYLSFKQLHQLKLEIFCPEVGQVNHVLQIQLQFKQSNHAIRYLMIHLPESQQRILLNEMSGNIALEFTPTTRGAFELPRIKIMSSYPFGIVQAWTYLQVTQKYGLHPQVSVSRWKTSMCSLSSNMIWMTFVNCKLIEKEIRYSMFHGSILHVGRDG